MVRTRQTANDSLTPQQKRFLDFLEEFHRENGYAPSQREIAKALGFSSVGTIQRYKEKLEELGMLESSGANRGLKIKQREESAAAIKLPLVGRVAAGYPIEAIEQQEEIEIPASFINRRGEHFVLTVDGESMIGDGILPGDRVVIRRESSPPANGQTVVALVNNEATIKRFYRKTGAIELHPANPKFPVISVPPDADFRIEGVLVAVLRTFDH
jgi:repressor LexA